MRILAIDPGTDQSGWVIYEGRAVLDKGVSDNETMLSILREQKGRCDLLAVEMIASYGMAVGREVFETCVFIGRLLEAWNGKHRMVYRQEVKLHMCKSPRAKDANVRQALIDMLGAPGSKKNPGPTFGVSSHAWQALGVAVTAAET